MILRRIYWVIFLAFFGYVIFRVTTDKTYNDDTYYLVNEYYCIDKNRELNLFFLTEDSDSFLLYDGPSYYFISESTILVKKKESLCLGIVEHSSLRYYLVKITIIINNCQKGYYRNPAVLIEYNDSSLKFYLSDLEIIDDEINYESDDLILATDGKYLKPSDESYLSILYNNKTLEQNIKHIYHLDNEQPFENYIKIKYLDRYEYIAYFNNTLSNELSAYFSYLVEGVWN